MKNPFIFFLFVFSGVTLQAQVKPSKNEVLKKTLENAKSYKTMAVDMTIHIETDFFEKDTNVTARLLIKGEKFFLSSEKHHLISDGEYLYSIDTVTNKADKEYLTHSSGEIWPNELFTFFEEGFTSIATGIKKDEKGREIMTIELSPEKGKKTKYLSTKLYIDINKFQLTQVNLRDKNGPEAHFIFTSIIIDEELDDKLFTFDASKYPER